jgi:hypothetical protein
MERLFFADRDKTMGDMSKQQFGFRADEQLAEDIKSYKQANNLSQSDAIRRLVQGGLRADEMEKRIEQLEQRVEEVEQQDIGVMDVLFG